MDWEECLRSNKARTAIKDKNLAKSCIDMADRVLESIKMIKLNERVAPVVTSNMYDALLNICEAILSLKGFKSYSHECITSFLSIVLKEDKSSGIFDRYRKIRNNVRYYGRTVSVETAKRAIEEISKVISYLKRKYLNI